MRKGGDYPNNTLSSNIVQDNLASDAPLLNSFPYRVVEDLESSGNFAVRTIGFPTFDQDGNIVAEWAVGNYLGMPAGQRMMFDDNNNIIDLFGNVVYSLPREVKSSDGLFTAGEQILRQPASSPSTIMQLGTTSSDVIVRYFLKTTSDRKGNLLEEKRYIETINKLYVRSRF